MGRIKVVVITGGMPKFEVKNVDFQGGGSMQKNRKFKGVHDKID